MRLVNGFPCRNCADAELAKKGVDPAHPQREYHGGEVFVGPQAELQRDQMLGKNVPEAGATTGSQLNLYA